MADKLSTVPSKGILKTSSSFDQPDSRNVSTKATKWDEMNILQTLHPPDKDYGHMKIEEPKTPYNYSNPSDNENDCLDADLLAQKINLEGNSGPKVLTGCDDDDDDEEEEEEDLSPEGKRRRDSFEHKRKLHYNEFQAVKLARQLMAADEADEGEDDDDDEEIEEKAEEMHEVETDNISL